MRALRLSPSAFVARANIEQKFGVMGAHPTVMRIRYYDVEPDRFSWVADRSADGGVTWEKDYLLIEARRIGPARRMGALTGPPTQ